MKNFLNQDKGTFGAGINGFYNFRTTERSGTMDSMIQVIFVLFVVLCKSYRCESTFCLCLCLSQIFHCFCLSDGNFSGIAWPPRFLWWRSLLQVLSTYQNISYVLEPSSLFADLSLSISFSLFQLQPIWSGVPSKGPSGPVAHPHLGHLLRLPGRPHHARPHRRPWRHRLCTPRPHCARPHRWSLIGAKIEMC